MKTLTKRLLALLLVLTVSMSTMDLSAYAQVLENVVAVEQATDVSENAEPFVSENEETTVSGNESVEPEENGWDGTTTESVYEGEGYKVTFTLSSYWEGGYNANVKVENTGDETIQDWYLKFNLSNQISNIWNAEIYQQEDAEYIIKNAGWNQDIQAGNFVEFGISANENFGGFPAMYMLLGEEAATNREDCIVAYHLDSDWGDGFTGTITITNNSDKSIEDWRLDFDFSRNITNIWNGVVESHEGNHYVIKNAGYNANIAPGQTISFGFNGNDGLAENEPENSTLYSYVVNQKIDLESDTDNDGAEDYIEEYFGTDTKKEDTDGDGLSDFIELYSLVLDPLSTDSDGNGIEDSEEDTDGDGLSNITEVRIGSSIVECDTDDDGLNDFDEHITYTTNPCQKDTDTDGVSDLREIEVGTNPLVYEETFQMIVNAENEDTVKVSVEMNLPGNQAETLKVEKHENEFLFPETMPGYIGGAYDFSVDGTFDKAAIKFEFDEALLADSSFDPVIYYFNEETQLLEELNTAVVGNVASTEVTHFSKYILLNRKVFQDAFEWEDVWSTTGYTGVEVVLVIDDSHSMGWNDGTYQRLVVARNLIDKLPENSKIGIVKFSGNVTLLTTTLTEDREYAGSFLTKEYFTLSPSTSMYTAIQQGFSLFESEDDTIAKMMVVLSDGEAQDYNKHSSVVTKANELNVKIHTVGLGSSTRYFTDYLKPLANNTAGAFYLASDAGKLEEIYDDINKKIDMETDSDEDGIADYYEENMVLFNGVTIRLDKNDPDTDGDGLLDGEEVAELNYEYNADRTKVIVRGKLVSDPLAPDSDGDGLTDEEEIYYYGTSPMFRDSDFDGLDDGTEIAEWYDPLCADADGDGRLDSLEYQEGTSPYVYDKAWYEHTWDFISGFIAGDFIEETDSLPTMLGQIASSFIPLVDIRDVVANLVHGDYAFAGLSALGLIPAGGDAAKTAGKVGKFVVKNIGNAAVISGILVFVGKNFPDALKALGKNEDFVSAAKALSNGSDLKLTKSEAKAINESFEKAGIPECVVKGGKHISIEDILKRYNLNCVGDVWNLDERKRGNVIEELLAHSEYIDWWNCGADKAGYFPVVDFQKGLDVVSLKTIDPTLPTYQNGVGDKMIISYIDALDCRITIDGEIANKILDVRIPKGTGNSLDILKLMDYAFDKGITVIIKEF